MSTFKYNEEPLSDDELATITVYLSTVKNVDYFAKRLRNNLKITCCDDCPMAILIKRGQVILDCLASMPDKDDRARLIVNNGMRDLDFVCKFVVGHIDCEGTMAESEKFIQDGHSEGLYLEFMNTLKHMYAVKKRYWE